MICELKKGSQQAFNAIYQMYAKRLYAFSFQYTKSSQDAEEIVEDVFVRLWLERTNIRQTETLKSLLFIMAKNYLINAYRSRINSPVFEDYHEAVADDTASVKVEYDEFFARVVRLIDKLPNTQRQVIQLSRMEQLSNKEIAERLSLNEQTVKNQLSLGLKTLKKDLYKSFSLMWLLFFVN